MEVVAGNKAVVLGLGVSGAATVRYLRSRGMQVAVSELRNYDQLNAEERDLLQGLEVETGGHSEAFIQRADYLVPSPGVPLGLPVLESARAKGIPILGELALAAGEISVPVVAVTGSNGKTTVTGLIGEIARSGGYNPFVGGNIGTPLVSYLLSPAGYDLVVLELSSFQLEISGAFRVDIALLLNLSPDHLDRHGGMEAYARAKSRIFSGQRPDDTAILGGDDPAVMEQAKSLAGRVLTFGHGDSCQARIVDSGILVARDDGEELYDLEETALNSKVNRLNAAAAILAAQRLGVTGDRIREGIARYAPPEHRMTLVAEIDGVRFINDSKATNIGALAAALDSCPLGVILIAGGINKGADFSIIKDLVRQKVKRMLCIGEAGDLLVATFSGVTAVEKAADMASAVSRAAFVAIPGQTVLLAPGCASFDMFSGYAERGRVFAGLVEEVRLNKEKMRKCND